MPSQNDLSASDDRLGGLLRAPQVTSRLLPDEGAYPNNARLPLLVYAGAVCLPQHDPASAFEDLFQAHGWEGAWRDGVYRYHHYHSTAHEVLGVYRGTARVQLGGPHGLTVEVHPGDVLILPAGVAHKNLGASSGFGVVGAYPRGQRPDLNTGGEGERPRADRQIAQVPLPAADPVYGAQGPLAEHWS